MYFSMIVLFIYTFIIVIYRATIFSLIPVELEHTAVVDDGNLNSYEQIEMQQNASYTPSTSFETETK